MAILNFLRLLRSCTAGESSDLWTHPLGTYTLIFQILSYPILLYPFTSYYILSYCIPSIIPCHIILNNQNASYRTAPLLINNNCAALISFYDTLYSVASFTSPFFYESILNLHHYMPLLLCFASFGSLSIYLPMSIYLSINLPLSLTVTHCLSLNLSFSFFLSLSLSLSHTHAHAHCHSLLLLLSSSLILFLSFSLSHCHSHPFFEP